jgi:lipopolysaccharide transport system ATP-binding protein
VSRPFVSALIDTYDQDRFIEQAILGMKKSEIVRKFDESVAFAELEKFIDTPIRHYSGGMFVRLAFAVAARLEPEVLLVDNILAVGDIIFQRKCLGKMGDVARAGRTVVLVSHDLNQIRRLFHHVVWVDKGMIRQNGPAHEVVSVYESAMANGEPDSGSQKTRDSATKGHILSWEIVEPCGEDPSVLSDLEPVTVEFTVDIRQPIRMGRCGVALRNYEQQVI